MTVKFQCKDKTKKTGPDCSSPVLRVIIEAIASTLL